jgi:uncharacterized membrane-anchored protein YhcB (DUF1043 family)
MRTTTDLAKKWAAPAIALVMGAATGCMAHHVGQPHMRDALSLLQDARAELDRAEADKGGHRVAAIGKVDEAIAEVRAGMEFSRTH